MRHKINKACVDVFHRTLGTIDKVFSDREVTRQEAGRIAVAAENAFREAIEKHFRERSPDPDPWNEARPPLAGHPAQE